MKNVSLLFAITAALFVGARSARETPQAVSLDARSTAKGIHVMELTQDFLAVAAHKLPYGNPNTGDCMAGEQKVSIQGIPGSFCSPACSPTQPCPADKYHLATAEGQCVLQPPGASKPSQCVPTIRCVGPSGGSAQTKRSSPPRE